MEQAAQEYHHQLATKVSPGNDPSGAIGYLCEHSIDFAIAAEYQLGYVAEPIMGDQRFTGMLAVPYLSKNGVTAIKFRALGDRRGSKYTQHNGQKHRLYNTPAFFAAGSTIGITEGELDAIVATERLGLPSVGVPGTQHWDSRLWKPLFSDYSTVVILADGDEPGKEFASKLAEDLGWRALIAQCPEGEDVSSMAAHGRTAELRELYSTSNQEAS